MKIVILRGSPRKGQNTDSITDIFVNQLKDKHEIKEYRLYEMDVRPCTACRYCQQDWENLKCIQNDDVQQIIDAVYECELLVVATPIYIWYSTPPVMSALNRIAYALCKFYDGKAMGPSYIKDKQLAVITTCGYPPEKGADIFEEGMKRFCKHSGMKYAGMLAIRHEGYHIPFMTDEKAEKTKDFAVRWI